MKASILDVFDATNREHVNAFSHLNRYGYWPASFWEKIKDLEFPNSWQVGIISKLADAYIKQFNIKSMIKFITEAEEKETKDGTISLSFAEQEDIVALIERLEILLEQAKGEIMQFGLDKVYYSIELEKTRKERDQYKAQRDRLAEAIRKHRLTLPFTQDYSDVQLYEALAAVEGGSNE